MGILFPKYGSLVTGGAIGDGLFFFCSGFTLFMGRQDGFPNWYKRRINRIYPTIIMWALVSAVIFNWNWQITDLITTPKYWFIPCIMVYYVIFYLIRTYLLKYLNQVFGIVFLLNQEKSGYELRMYNQSGDTVFSREIQGDYSHVKMDGDNIILYDGSKCCIYTTTGILKFKGDLGADAQEIFDAFGLNRYYVMSDNELRIVYLTK